ncbi:MAG: prepilin-type N-terminal cleavage/methylation domain-containing protein [Thermodesulfovibrionales bacterium]
MRRKAISYQLSAIRSALCFTRYTLHATRYTLSKKGTTLVELIVTLAIFSIIVTMMYSSFSTFLKQVTIERKVAKTELDVFNVSWPLIKEIETAGFGVPKSGTCGTAISESGGVLTIHSTAAGNDQYAGAWSYVTPASAVYGVAGTAMPGVPTGEKVVIINNLDKSRMGLTSVTTNDAGGGYYYLTDTTSNYMNNIAYWTPYVSGTDLECYETKYSLTAYNPASSKPATCAELTQKLSRSSSKTTTENPDPLLDCVLTLAYRFGCINASTGNLTWQTGTSCGTSKLRLMKIGMVIQSSTKGTSSPATITLFEDLGAALAASTTLTTEQRNYRWRKLEQTITLKNQE